MTGKNIRLSRIFDSKTNRSFIVAFDHGQSLPIPDGLGNPVDLLERIVAGNPEGILLNRGMLEQGAHLFGRCRGPEPILRVDWTTLDPNMKKEMGEAYRVLTTPQEALELGATAVCMYLIGRPAADGMFYDNVQEVAHFIAEAHQIGLPVIVEATLWGLRNEDQKDPKLLRQMCRIAAEIGADAIKTEYVGDVEAERTLIEEVGNIPVLTLGGSAADRSEVSRLAGEAIESGARGLIYGRNVWQVEDMAGVMKELSAIVHGDAK